MTHRLSTFFNAYAPPIAWATVIFLLSSQSVLAGFDESVINFIMKKSAHIFVYAVLYVLLYRAVHVSTPKINPLALLLLPILLTLSYAVSDELHQSLVPGRTATFRDIGYDMLGMFIAFLRLHRYI